MHSSMPHLTDSQPHSPIGSEDSEGSEDLAIDGGNSDTFDATFTAGASAYCRVLHMLQKASVCCLCY